MTDQIQLYHDLTLASLDGQWRSPRERELMAEMERLKSRLKSQQVEIRELRDTIASERDAARDALEKQKENIASLENELERLKLLAEVHWREASAWTVKQAEAVMKEASKIWQGKLTEHFHRQFQLK